MKRHLFLCCSTQCLNSQVDRLFPRNIAIKTKYVRHDAGRMDVLLGDLIVMFAVATDPDRFRGMLPDSWEDCGNVDRKKLEPIYQYLISHGVASQRMEVSIG
jgi:hypothetical protein